MEDLFDRLLKHGFENVLQSETGYWKTMLPSPYHIFGGKPCRFGVCEPTDVPGPTIKLLLAPPVTGKEVRVRSIPYCLTLAVGRILTGLALMISKPVFYDNEQYAKRLIGNAFSVPTTDILLRELRSKFAHRTYQGYDYGFAWIPKSAPGSL